MNIVLGFRNAPRCVPCLAAGLQRNAEEFRDYLVAYLQRRDCHRMAWTWANHHEAVKTNGLPACLVFQIRADSVGVEAGQQHEQTQLRREDDASIAAATEWDAADMGCGELVLELRLRLESMHAGEIMKLSARDPGAREDLPAWCRLTGHILLRNEPPNYWIQRKK
jgi:tRNA 2-thiouridine synthesizing protein A